MEKPKLKTAFILLAAGSAQRMGRDKLLLQIAGKTPIAHCAAAINAAQTDFVQIVIAVSPETEKEARRAIPTATIVRGGKSRAESVRNSLRAVADADYVVIHDAARCLVTPRIIDASINAAIEHGSGVAAVDARDTVRFSGEVIERDKVTLAQTPQSFAFERIMRAYADAADEATDDCALYERLGYEPFFSEGSLQNQKLTYPQDIQFFEAVLRRRDMRIGYGEDTHRLETGCELVLGGEKIPFEKGLSGHSDADVLVHAVADAIIGALSMGDIGKWFPDSDPAYKGISSLLLLEKVSECMRKKGLRIANCDTVIVAQRPKLSAYTENMERNIAKVLDTDCGNINVKASTTEGCGPEGRGECITARAVCILENDCE